MQILVHYLAPAWFSTLVLHLGSSSWFFDVNSWFTTWLLLGFSTLVLHQLLLHPRRLPFTNYASAVPTTCLQWPPSLTVSPYLPWPLPVILLCQTYPSITLPLFYIIRLITIISLPFQGPSVTALAPNFYLFYLPDLSHL